MTITGSSTAVLEAPPKAVFETLTRIEGLPSWNDRMTGVVEQPARWRRVLLRRIRARQLAHTEVPASLAALASAAALAAAPE